MATKQLILPDKIVKKSNALARARWAAESVWEPRLVALLSSKVRVQDTDFHIYEIPVSEILANSGGRDYREIESAIDKIMSRVITIREADGNWKKYNIFSRCGYRKKEGILELRFDPDLKPHYLNLQKHFAQYNLFEYLILPSIYSQRIFEILKSWSDKPEVTIPLTELHDMLNAPQSFRANFKDFRRWTLEKAHKDIHKHTDFYFEWEPVKKGRAVGAIRFIFGKQRLAIKAQKQKDDEKKLSTESNKLFLQAMECAKEKIAADGTCRKRTKSKKLCEFCSAHKMLDEMTSLAKIQSKPNFSR